MHTGKELEAP